MNSIKSSNQAKTSSSVTAVAAISLGIVLVVACRMGNNQTSPVTKSGAGQVVITGDVSKTFTPEEVNPVKIVDHVGINLVENFPCGISIQFPMNLKPGAYPIGDHLHAPAVDVSAEYSPDCGKGGIYLSTKGRLNLTASGDKYTGTFQFDAGLNRDETKVIKVSGSFNDISLH